MVAVALTIGRFSRVLPGAASIYSYISHGLGEGAASSPRGCRSATTSSSCRCCWRRSGSTAPPPARTSSASSVDWWIWALIAAAIVTVLSIVGIRLSLRIDLVLAVICDGFLLRDLADDHRQGHRRRRLHALRRCRRRTRRSDFTGLSLAIAFGVLIFLGFEQCFVLGEEVSDPHGNVPKAIYTALALVGVVLFLATFALVSGFGRAGIGTAERALRRARARHGSRSSGRPRHGLGGRPLSAGPVLDPLATRSRAMNSVVRIQYGMGRARALPAPARLDAPGPADAVRRDRRLRWARGLAITLFAGLVWGPTTMFAFLGFVHRPRGGRRVHSDPARGAELLPPGARREAVLRNYGRAGRRDHRSCRRSSTRRSIPDPGYPLKWAPWVLLGWLVVGVIYLVWRVRTRQPVDLDYAFRDLGEDRCRRRRRPPSPSSH